MFFCSAWIVSRWGVVGWSRKSYLGPVKIVSFSSRDFSQSNKHDTFSLVGSTGYFYVLFLWTIAVPDFRLLEIIKTKAFPYLLPIITFTVNSHADNHFYKHIILFDSNIVHCEISFYIKIHVKVLTKVFYIQIWFTC